jgi:hypothetical protein
MVSSSDEKYQITLKVARNLRTRTARYDHQELKVGRKEPSIINFPVPARSASECMPLTRQEIRSQALRARMRNREVIPCLVLILAPQGI